MPDIDQYIETWKNRLLDLGKRNRLINYRETKRSNIKIIAPSIDELYEKLVVKEDSLNFPFSIDGNYDDPNDIDTNSANNGDLVTDRNINEQQKTLANLRSRAKIAVEEQGVNILYLSFGFLRWKESDDSEQILSSPMVLVPVTLKLESITSPFVLGLHEDEIVVNPTLIHRLENDFGINLPEFDSDEGGVKSYLDEVNRITKNNRWEVINDVGISLLSFLKINMYKDLDTNKSKIKLHPIIKSLTGDISGMVPLSDDLNNFNHDENIRPIDTYQVVDADSSQQDAILYAKKGISFVLQGPPGTGKSQTITNIISESLADGKKVLFVSEKMAALEVVHKRLSQVGLDDFCLTLHSQKANKKVVLNELGRTLNLKRIRVQDNALYQLELLNNERDRLNKYDKELHTICQPLGKSIFEINGRLSKLIHAPDIIFTIDDIGGTTPEKFNLFTQILNDLANTIGKMSEDYSVNPWRSCHATSLPHELRHDIETYLILLSPKLDTLTSSIYETTNYFGLEIKVSVNAIIPFLNFLETCSNSPKVPMSWVYEDRTAPLLEQATYYKNLTAEHSVILNELSQKYNDEYFALPAFEIIANYKSLFAILKQTLNSSTYFSEADIIESLRRNITLFQTCLDGIEIIIQTSEKAEELLGVKKLNSIYEAFAFMECLEWLLSSPKPTEEWFDTDKFNVVKKVFEEANKIYVELLTERNNLLSEFDKDILVLDYSSMLTRFNTQYTSFFKIFRKGYKSDKQTIRLLSKDVTKIFDDKTIIKILNELKSIDRNNTWIVEKHDFLVTLLGSDYLNEYTDWVTFSKKLINFEKIVGYFGSHNFPLKTRSILLDNGIKCDEINNLYNRIKTIKEIDLINILTHNLNVAENLEPIEIKKALEITISALEGLSTEYSKMTQYLKQVTSFDEIITNFSKLDRMESIATKIEHESDSLKVNYQFLFHGMDTDWVNILNSLTWTSEFKRLIEKYNLPSSFIQRICEDDHSIIYAREMHNIIQQEYNNIDTELCWFISLFDNKEELLESELTELLSRIRKCINGLSLLEEWIDFRSARDRCKEVGLSDFLEKIETIKIEKHRILSAFLKRFYRLWLDAVMPQYPAVYSFRRRSHEELINEFANLDKSQLRIAQSRVREILESKLPDTNKLTSAVDEVSILKRELNKQRKILPLRKLFKAIPNLILTLKPCLMMSPLSVSLFLEANNYHFDIVIFDEASQVCTEDAIGTIMRGKQAIIVGDSKQLPPTNFFATTTSESEFDTDDEDEDDNIDSDGYDSVLDQAVTVFPERTLRWHYRSRNEDLIAFSNSKIYNNNLITFPTNKEREPDSGVEYIYVPNGIYDRSGKRNNSVEASKVAEIVFNHIRNYPRRSLGVVTFSEPQQQAVESAILEKRLLDQSSESFFAEDKEDAFFIKNLENVQGDERDTIIFSIGYAKDRNGVMHMNFGPLSKTGGYRRLNVAITRAKYNIKLIGSIYPTDINLENTTSEGVKMLRSYIEYAINGPQILERELSVPDRIIYDSPFEESVYEFLISKGYKVATQVGCSGYRIDMAVKHPSLSGIYVLGIECDGATYHSARTARERDRLRQTILEDMGWKIYRIWSTDWIKDPVTEGGKLVDAVENAISIYSENDLNVIVENKDGFIVSEEGNTNSFEVPIDNTIGDKVDGSNPYNFAYYEEANVHEIKRDPNDYIYIADVIKFVVKKEYPIHSELLCRRLACLFGNKKATNKIQNSVNYILDHYLKNEIYSKNNFYWPHDNGTVIVRIPGDKNLIRPINYISTEELAEALFNIASKSFGIKNDDLFTATARVFGFNRTGGNISQAMQKACEYLIENNRAKNIDGKIIV
jgi:very-short-patch-repair endonuclease